MLNLDHPRDLVMIGAVFGLAAFIWAGWGQENPPAHVVWRVLLGVFSAAGLALVALSVPVAIRHWHTSTALTPSGTGFTVYIIVFWAEVVIAALLAIFVSRAGHSEWIAPIIMVVVGVHFFALAFVFAQPVLHLAAVLITVTGIVAWLIPTEDISPSFWCGVFGAPIFLAIGTWCYLAGAAALRGDG